MTLETTLQSLHHDAIIELFVLDLSVLSGGTYRWHGGTNGLTKPIVWQGATYEPRPVEASGWEASVQGTLPRPKLKVSNLTDFLVPLLDQYQDMVGATVTRKRTLARYLDAVNFPGGFNASANSTEEFPNDIYLIERKVLQTPTIVEFELATAFDLEGVLLPRRLILPICQWEYRSAECGYAGGAVAKEDDTATAILAEDKCGKRRTSCRLRFPHPQSLPFGGFPGAGMVRIQ